MSTEKSTTEQDLLSPAQRVRNDWRYMVETLSYKAIVNNLPFIGFIVLLCMFYIGNSNRAVQLQADITKQTKVLKELRWRYMDEKSQLMQVRTETQVMKNAQRIGLKSSRMPAYKISK